MKKLFLLLLVGLPSMALAQKVELGAHLTSGVASFQGNGTASSSFVNGSDTSPYSYVNDPFGNGWGASYGAAAQAQWVGKRGLLAGVQLGYDMLRPATKIDSYSSLGKNTAADGTAHLVQQFINFTPYLGQRLRLGAMALDATAGLEIARQLASREKAEYTLNGRQLTIDNDQTFRDWDYRLHAALTLSRGPLSLTISYAHGLSNYRSEFVGGPMREAYLRVVRIGAGYTFR